MLAEFPQFQRSLLTSALPFATTHLGFKKKVLKKEIPLTSHTFVSVKDTIRYKSYLKEIVEKRVGSRHFSNQLMLKIRSFGAEEHPLC